MALEHPLRRKIAGAAPQGGAGFNAYAAGKKHYGAGRGAPNVGKTGLVGQIGYQERDVKTEARKQALLRRTRG